MAHVAKEKLKYLKDKLKVWNKEVYGILDINIDGLVRDMNVMEEEADNEEWEREKCMRLSSEFWSTLHHKESFLAQKAKVDWIQQGDGNTRFFHNMVKYRERRNQIEMIKVGDSWVSDVGEIKEEVRRHLGGQFKEIRFARPTLDGINFKIISEDEADFLVSPFSIEEVKEAVWSCEGNKSLGPDSLNFTFIKSCWGMIKK